MAVGLYFIQVHLEIPFNVASDQAAQTRHLLSTFFFCSITVKLGFINYILYHSMIITITFAASLYQQKTI